MNGARLLTLLPTLHTRRPLTVIGAAVIDIIADARRCRVAEAILNCNNRASMSAAVR